MTAIFFDRVNGGNRRFDGVVEMKFGMMLIDGSYEQIVQIFFPHSAETLKLAEHRLQMVHQ